MRVRECECEGEKGKGVGESTIWYFWDAWLLHEPKYCVLTSTVYTVMHKSGSVHKWYAHFDILQYNHYQKWTKILLYLNKMFSSWNLQPFSTILHSLCECVHVYKCSCITNNTNLYVYNVNLWIHTNLRSVKNFVRPPKCEWFSFSSFFQTSTLTPCIFLCMCVCIYFEHFAYCFTLI